jgi:hypothetical protein
MAASVLRLGISVPSSNLDSDRESAIREREGSQVTGGIAASDTNTNHPKVDVSKIPRVVPGAA